MYCNLLALGSCSCSSSGHPQDLNYRLHQLGPPGRDAESHASVPSGLLGVAPGPPMRDPDACSPCPSSVSRHTEGVVRYFMLCTGSPGEHPIQLVIAWAHAMSSPGVTVGVLHLPL